MLVADTVLMVRPAAFGWNAEAALTNASQRPPEGRDTAVSLQETAAAEHSAFVAALRDAGVDVIVAEDAPEPPRPDAVFPNNWVSFHADGTVVLYPMCVATRRAERRPEVLDAVGARHAVRRVLDLSGMEREGLFVEGTGSLVFDHAARTAFAALSPRTSQTAARRVCEAIGYTLVPFHADVNGAPPYHTNVVMAVCPAFAVVATPAIAPDDRGPVLARLAAGGRDVVELDLDEYHAFAANLLALRSRAGEPRIVMSAGAAAGLRPATRSRLEQHGRLVTPAIPTIERIGGGSARCLLAEVFLPRL